MKYYVIRQKSNYKFRLNWFRNDNNYKLMLKRYYLADYEKIINASINYTLENSVINIIQELSEQVGAPGYVKTPHFTNNIHNKDNRVYQNEILKFETTHKLKSEGIDISIDLIRKLLNKITVTTYNDLFPLLLDELNKFSSFSDEENSKLGKIIFSFVSETPFYSELYAKLFSELYIKYPFLKNELTNKICLFNQSINEITYYNPDINYDAFCKNNKENTRRKSIAVFFVNLAKEKIIEIDKVYDIIIMIQDSITSKLNQDSAKEIIDELSEISGDMILSGKDFINNGDRWKKIVLFVETISKMKVKQHKSLSNKAIFKHMDVIDAIK